MTEKEIEKLNLSKYTEDSKKRISIYLEVNLEYPQELHDIRHD